MYDISLIQELTLVRELMAVIERFNSDHNITANPGPIRDTLLCVAGLLHREVMQFEKHSDLQRLADSFAERARSSIEEALQTLASDSVRTPH